jgi:hypothetical protein
MIIPETDINIEMMNACKESRLLFFEEKIERSIKGYETKKAYADYKSTEKKKVTKRLIIIHLN